MTEKEFARYIDRLIQKQDLSAEEAAWCFSEVIANHQPDMQQGAFLAALTAKGVTATEIASAWQILCELDTTMIDVETATPLVENSGTGMDNFKTFNISTAASIIAAADGIPIARHGSRAITSHCGAVDMAEALGVNVECPPEVVKASIESIGLGLFNGMSELVHPRALSRILSQASFGSVLNIAASLANPARPRMAVRGVYHPSLLYQTAEAMREIGYCRALVVYGELGNGELAIDEASTLGRTIICELSPDGTISEYQLHPAMFDIASCNFLELASCGEIRVEAYRMRELLAGSGSAARRDIACLNAALIMYVASRVDTIVDGYRRAQWLLQTDLPTNKLTEWISTQQ